MNYIILPFLVILLLTFSFIFSVAIFMRSTKGALFIPTPYSSISKVLDEVEIKRGLKVVDLGSGDGRILKELSKRFDVEAIGYEINPILWLYSKLKNLGNPKIKIKRADFLKENLSYADIVFCYLFPDIIQVLKGKFERELKPGSIIISFNFPFPSWKPYKIIEAFGSEVEDPVYIYKITRSLKGLDNGDSIYKDGRQLFKL